MTNLTKYNILWNGEQYTSSSFNQSYGSLEYFIPADGALVRSQFPTHSIALTLQPYNFFTTRLIDRKLAQYNIQMASSSINTEFIINYNSYVNFHNGSVDRIYVSHQYEIQYLISCSMDWQSIPTSSIRTGLYVRADSGSPQLNIQTNNTSIFTLYPKYYAGDFFYSSSDGYYISFETYNDYRRILTLRNSENLARFTTTEKPNSLHIGFNHIVQDGFFETYTGMNSLESGALWKNYSWNGGLYMPDSNQIGIWSTNNFIVTSGSLIAQTGAKITGNIIYSGSRPWYINTGSNFVSYSINSDSNVSVSNIMRIAEADFISIDGESGSFQISTNPVPNVFLYSGSIINPINSNNAEIRMYSASGDSGSNHGTIYMNGQWYNFLSASSQYGTISDGTF